MDGRCVDRCRWFDGDCGRDDSKIERYVYAPLRGIKSHDRFRSAARLPISDAL